MIRTIVFDLGNVLVHFCHNRMVDQLATVCGSDAITVRNLLIDSGVQWDFERGRVTENQLHAHFESNLGRSIELPAMLNAAADIFELNEPMVAIIDDLHRQGYRLVLLSNTCVTHYEFVRRNWRLLDCFDDFVLSYKVGAIKPEPAIFDAMLNVLDCPPHEAFYTDDIPAYIDAARQRGVNAEIFTDADKLITDLNHQGVTVTIETP